MSFLETPRFPTNISYGATGGPRFFTDVAITDSGAESRNQVWSQTRARYDVSHAARIKSDYETVRDHFMAVRGRLHGFRFKDWGDFQVTSSQGIFASLTATTFQMYRSYMVGTLTFNKKIVKPVSGTVTVTGGSSPSVDYTTGIVTVSSGTPTAWAGEFDVPCRYDIDDIGTNLIARSGGVLVEGWTGIALVEILP